MKRGHQIVHMVFALFFLAYMCIGFFVYRDYGVFIDEYSQIDIGRVNYERIAHGSLEIQTHFDRYYGPVFEVPLYICSSFLANSALGMDEMDSRRLIMFVFFAISAIFYYRFLSNVFDHPLYGLLGTVLLIFSPRIFAESFYNTKDIAFVSAVIFVLWSLSRMKVINWKSIGLISLTTGFAMAMRAQGLFILIVVTMALIMSGKEYVKKRIFFSLFYVVIAIFLACLMSPVFWNDTFKNMIGYWQSSANPVGVPTYYFGKILISPNIPWHYHFVWVAITSLLSVLITCLFGIVWFVMSFFHNKYAIRNYNRSYIVMALIILGTLMVSVFFHPRSYDGWRHIYYIYPCMIGFSLYAIKTCVEYRKTHVFFGALIIICICMLVDIVGALRFMKKNHPNQYVYFNVLAGGYARAKSNFDFDYWGVSYKQLYEYLDDLPIKKITYIYYEQILPYVEFVMIPKLSRKGFKVVQTPQEADIYVSIQRDYKMPPSQNFLKVYSPRVEGVDVSAIYATGAYLK